MVEVEGWVGASYGTKKPTIEYQHPPYPKVTQAGRYPAKKDLEEVLSKRRQYASCSCQWWEMDGSDRPGPNPPATMMEDVGDLNLQDIHRRVGRWGEGGEGGGGKTGVCTSERWAPTGRTWSLISRHRSYFKNVVQFFSKIVFVTQHTERMLHAEIDH